MGPYPCQSSQPSRMYLVRRSRNKRRHEALLRIYYLIIPAKTGEESSTEIRPASSFSVCRLTGRKTFLGVSLCLALNRLPDGTVIASGFEFRNEFHLNPLGSADLFNPCGGRPASITPFNVDRLFDDRGVPRFKFIVEGANVFITDEARRILEERGVILFKDGTHACMCSTCPPALSICLSLYLPPYTPIYAPVCLSLYI